MKKWYRYKIVPSPELDYNDRKEFEQLLKEGNLKLKLVYWKEHDWRWYNHEHGKHVYGARAYGVEKVFDKPVSSGLLKYPKKIIEFTKTDNEPYIVIELYQDVPYSLIPKVCANRSCTWAKEKIWSIETVGRGNVFFEDKWDNKFVGKVVEFRESGANSSNGRNTTPPEHDNDSDRGVPAKSEQSSRNSTILAVVVLSIAIVISIAIVSFMFYKAMQEV